MTDAPTPTVAAGWYPDPAGSPRSRWWDGTQWTEHFQEPYSHGVTQGALKAPEGTNTNTLWIWLIIAVMALLLIPTVVVDYDEYLRQSTLSYAAAYTPTDIMLNLSGWIGVVAYVLLAVADWRRLKANGVPRPFHWAWMFFALITPLVYVIGRTVVVRRRTGSGLAPLWVAIGVTIATWVVAIVVIVPPAVRYMEELLKTYPVY